MKKDNIITNKTVPNISELERKIEQLTVLLQNTGTTPLNKNGNKTMINNLDLKFTKKELKQMPFLSDCKIRKKTNGVYEIRYRKNGYNMSFSSKTLQTAKDKCLEWLSALSEITKCGTHYIIVEDKNYKPQTKFSDFAKNYMLNVKKRNVKEKTFDIYMYSFNKHILPVYGNKFIDEIKPVFIQNHLNELSSTFPRSCEDVKNLLNGIFEYAVNNELINRNPIKAVFIPKHERVTGQALTKEEEKTFLEKIKGNTYENYFLFMLYSGCRICEYNTISINDDNTITVKNAKLKRYQKVKERTLPVFPMLKPYLNGLNVKLNGETASDVFSKIMPNHTLKDLRHTFTTRARECGIDNEVVSIWTAHSLGNITASVYTHFSKEFMQKQAEKFYYDL